MNTLFSSKILFPCFLFFFVSLDCISCTDKMLYQDGLENYFQLALPAVVGPESIAFDCNGKGPYVSVSDGRILKWQGAKLGWIEFSVSSPQRQDLKPLTYIYASAVHFVLHLPFYIYYLSTSYVGNHLIVWVISSHNKSSKTCIKMRNRASRYILADIYSNSLPKLGLNLASDACFIMS